MTLLTEKRKVSTASDSKKINQFIIDNYDTVSQGKIGERFNVSEKSINCRFDRLRKKGVLKATKNSKRDIGKKSTSLEGAYDYTGRNSKGSKGSAKTIANNKTKVVKKLNSYYKQQKKVGEANTYDNQGGFYKGEARVKMVRSILDSGILGTILTLPHIACKIEQMILGVIKDGVDFLGVEYNKDTFNKLRTYSRKNNLPIKTYYGKLSDKIYGFNRESYAHMIMDYCCSLNTIEKELIYAIDNKLVPVGGTMHITFSKRANTLRGTTIKSLTNTIQNTNGDNRCETDKGVEAFFNKVCGWDFELSEMFSYCDKQAMFYVRIKRLK